MLAQVTDVSSEAAVDALADRAFGEWDQVDLLVNNAGVFVGGFLWERPAADLEFVLGPNLWGILHGIRAFVPRMLAQGTEGHIVNTVSAAGLLGTPYAGPYSISKFAALAATESLASDLEAIGAPIKVTALCPGIVDTDIATGSERHRPPELATETTDDRAFVSDMLAEVTATGIPPSDVAEMVVGRHPGGALPAAHPRRVRARPWPGGPSPWPPAPCPSAATSATSRPEVTSRADRRPSSSWHAITTDGCRATRASCR